MTALAIVRARFGARKYISSSRREGEIGAVSRVGERESYTKSYTHASARNTRVVHTHTHTHAHTAQRAYFYLYIIISVFEKFGQVVQHRSRSRFPVWFVTWHTRSLLPRFPRDRRGSIVYNELLRRHVYNSCTRTKGSVKLAQIKREGKRVFYRGEEKLSRITVVVDSSCEISGNCDFLCRTILSWRVCCALYDNFITDSLCTSLYRQGSRGSRESRTGSIHVFDSGS